MTQELNPDTPSAAACPRVTTALFLALLAALPFLSSFTWRGHQYGLTFQASYLKLFAFETAVALAWASLLSTRTARLRDLLGSSGVGLPMAAILAWAALSVAWSPAPWTAAQPLAELAYMALGVLVFAHLLRGLQARHRFAAAYGIAAGAACAAYTICYVITYALGPPGGNWWMALYPFGNPNMAGAFALLPLAAGAAFAISGRAGKAWRIGGTLVALAAASAILVSRSASAMAAGLAALVLVVTFSFRGRVRRTILEVLCTLALLVLLWPFLAPELWQIGPGTWLAEQSGARPAIWQGAADLIRDRPITGSGLGSFAVAYTRVYPRDFAAHPLRSDLVESAHSLPLDIVAEVGLIGLALALWLLAAALHRARRAVSGAQHAVPLHDHTLILGILCGSLAMLAQGLVASTLRQLECDVNLVLAIALIGGMCAPTAPDLSPVRSIRRIRPVVLRLLAALLILAVFALTALPGLLSQAYQHIGFTAERVLAHRDGAPVKGPDILRQIDMLRRAIHTGWPTFWTLEARARLAALYQHTGHYTEALDAIQQADLLAPNLGGIRRREADVCLQLEDIDQGVPAILSYCRKNPFDPAAYRIWAALLALAQRQGRANAAQPQEALRLLDFAEQTRSPHLDREQARELKKPFLQATR